MAKVSLEASPWLRQVDRAGWKIPSWLAILIGATLPAALILVLPHIPGMARLQSLEPASMTALIYLVALGPLATVGVIVGLLVEKRPTRSAEAMSGWLGLPLGLLAGILAMIGALALVDSLADVHLAGLHELGLWICVVMALSLFQTAAEEIFFRGWLMPLLSARWGVWIGLLASSVLFAAPHFVSNPFTPLALVNDTLAGLLFGLLALRSGGLAMPIGAHFAWNFVEAHLLGAYPNPGIDPLGSWLDLEMAGPGLITGGEAALNGSVATTVLLGITAALVLAFPQRVGPPESGAA